uniref:Uncharacterized protein n=1 Tax=Corethron hystrix TaxID=216773 RepID=A0A7S1FTL4_9STRA|mmetsp:Transcript_26553/g.61136  ORF Transcript_26553/g.61136 Transcript_26553/m.61136 type:complete len:255 (+) Transcript_26553:178-942(+)
MPKNKRKSMASSDYFLESGQDKRSGDTSDVVKTIENVEKPRKRDLIAARLKEVILKPNPIVMKRREELRRKRVKRSQTGNSYSDDSHNRNSNRRNIHPQHHRNLSSWNDSDQSSDVSSHSSYYESSLDGDEAGWEENRKALHDKKEKKRSLRNLPKIYIVQQRYGVFATTFGIAQILILTVMVVYCGLAPILNPMINPMVGPYPDVLSYWGAKKYLSHYQQRRMVEAAYTNLTTCWCFAYFRKCYYTDAAWCSV